MKIAYIIGGIILIIVGIYGFFTTDGAWYRYDGHYTIPLPQAIEITQKYQAEIVSQDGDNVVVDLSFRDKKPEIFGIKGQGSKGDAALACIQMTPFICLAGGAIWITLGFGYNNKKKEEEDAK